MFDNNILNNTKSDYELNSRSCGLPAKQFENSNSSIHILAESTAYINFYTYIDIFP